MDPGLKGRFKITFQIRMERLKRKCALPETNIAPARKPFHKETMKLIFQPSIFRCENVSFREGRYFRILTSKMLGGAEMLLSLVDAGHFYCEFGCCLLVGLAVQAIEFVELLAPSSIWL